MNAAEDCLNESGVRSDHNVNMEVLMMKGERFLS